MKSLLRLLSYLQFHRCPLIANIKHRDIERLLGIYLMPIGRLLRRRTYFRFMIVDCRFGIRKKKTLCALCTLWLNKNVICSVAQIYGPVLLSVVYVLGQGL